jgi:NAD(P)-dependent dehydrogenase (short-subunit alcohol dehydrogenase family)
VYIQLLGMCSISEGPVSQWRAVLDLNVLGLSLCTKEALQSMKERGVDDGHIIHISRYKPTLSRHRPNVCMEVGNLYMA